MRNHLSSTISLILVLCLTIGGASATWTFATGGIEAIKSHLSVSMNEWDFGYSISFINNSTKLIDDITVTDNSKEYKLTKDKTKTGVDNVVDAVKLAAQRAEEWVKTNKGQNYAFSHWINAGSTRIDSIDAGNTEDVTLYPAFQGVYTAMFVDQNGNVLGWDTYTKNSASNIITLSNTLQNEGKIPETDELIFSHWEIIVENDDGTVIRTQLTESYLKSLQKDVTISPVYDFIGSASLAPVDSDGDGDTDYYIVDGYGGNTGGNDLVEIPAEVNGIPVTGINANAFMEYPDLHSVKIPASVTTIGSQSFADFEGTLIKKRQTITIYYEGTPEQWAQYMKEVYTDKNYEHFASDWDNAMGEKSAVFFLDENGKVDLSKGYWELADTSAWYQSAKFEWQYHSHPYGGNTSGCSNEHNNTTNYNGTCDCDSCDGKQRPDADYWN